MCIYRVIFGLDKPSVHAALYLSKMNHVYIPRYICLGQTMCTHCVIFVFDKPCVHTALYLA